MSSPLIESVDCVSLPVGDLDEALVFYRDRLGHELVWRMPAAIGLRLPNSEAELVLHTEDRPAQVELKVASVPEALGRFVAAGGSIIEGPFEIAIGLCALVADPSGNHLVLLDTSKGLLETDDQGNVINRGDGGAGGKAP